MTDDGSSPLLLSVVVCRFRYICCLSVSPPVVVHSRFASMQHSTLEERLRKRRAVVMPAKFNNASAPSTILRRSSASSLHKLFKQNKYNDTEQLLNFISYYYYKIYYFLCGNNIILKYIFLLHALFKLTFLSLFSFAPFTNGHIILHSQIREVYTIIRSRVL